MIRDRELVSIEDDIYKNILSSNKKKGKQPRKKYTTTTEKAITVAVSAVILLLAFGSAYYYNVFVNLQYKIEANLAQIDTQLQKRNNLLINLGTTVVEYSKHEREIFTHLAELRTLVAGGSTESTLEDVRSALDTSTPNGAKLNAGLANWESALSSLMAIAEQYPDLKLSENFRTFMDAILEFEGTIAELRMTYNNSVNSYSTIKDQIPGTVFATIFRCKDYDYFKVESDTIKFLTAK